VPTAIGAILILAGVVTMFFGDKQIPVRGSIILKLFRARSAHFRDGEGDWPYKFLFGCALIVAGVLVLKAAAKVL
jgi:hypothetical protein